MQGLLHCLCRELEEANDNLDVEMQEGDDQKENEWLQSRIKQLEAQIKASESNSKSSATPEIEMQDSAPKTQAKVPLFSPLFTGFKQNPQPTSTINPLFSPIPSKPATTAMPPPPRPKSNVFGNNVTVSTPTFNFSGPASSVPKPANPFVPNENNPFGHISQPRLSAPESNKKPEPKNRSQEDYDEEEVLSIRAELSTPKKKPVPRPQPVTPVQSDRISFSIPSPPSKPKHASNRFADPHAGYFEDEVDYGFSDSDDSDQKTKPVPQTIDEVDNINDYDEGQLTALVQDYIGKNHETRRTPDDPANIPTDNIDSDGLSTPPDSDSESEQNQKQQKPYKPKLDDDQFYRDGRVITGIPIGVPSMENSPPTPEPEPLTEEQKAAIVKRVKLKPKGRRKSGAALGAGNGV